MGTNQTNTSVGLTVRFDRGQVVGQSGLDGQSFNVSDMRTNADEMPRYASAFSTLVMASATAEITCDTL